jgi:coproporphyrinogen III oxidase-like Fe-S oxidoreductase
VAPWTAYQRVVVAGDDPTEGSESLSGDQVELERTYLALRTSTGLQREFVGSLNPAALEAAAERGWVLLDDTGVRCTPQGWLRLDALTTGLTTSAQGG